MIVKGVYTNYEQARGKIEFAVFVSRVRGGFFSTVIRIATSIFRKKKAKYSHTGFIFRERVAGVNRVVVYEADFGSKMLRKIPASVRFDNKLEYKIYVLDVPKEEEKRIHSSMFFKWGTSYDSLGAILSLVYNTETDSVNFCSEIVKKEMRLPIKGNLPQDIADYLDSQIVLST
jgi:hypothetical protein